jgi:Ca2+-binding RTX toxin-like protein
MPINVIGGVYNGTSGADNLTGGSWDDLFRMTANDYVTDYINGGGGKDTVDYSSSQVGVKITLTNAVMGGATGGMVEADFIYSLYPYSSHHQVVANLTSIENATGSNWRDTLIGNSGNNVLKGLGGNDTINGGAGSDTIVPGLGEDDLYGGAGPDVFVFTSFQDSGISYTPLPGGGFSSVQYGFDQIWDFEAGLDILDLSGIDADTTHAGNQAFHWVDQFSGAPGELQRASVNGGTYVGDFVTIAGDINGDASYDFLLYLTPSTSLDIIFQSDVIL